MALLILLTGSARTWVIASDLRMITDDRARFAGIFSGGISAGVGFSEGHLAAARTALQPLLGRFFNRDLKMVKRADGFDVNAVKHFFKQVEGLFFILDQRVFLSVPHLVDPFLQVIDRLQVV